MSFLPEVFTNLDISFDLKMLVFDHYSNSNLTLTNSDGIFIPWSFYLKSDTLQNPGVIIEIKSVNMQQGYHASGEAISISNR